MGSSPPGDRAFLIKHNYWETAGTLPLQSQTCQVPCHSLQRLPGFCPPPNYVRGLELCFLTKPSSFANLTAGGMYQTARLACPRYTVCVAERGILQTGQVHLMPIRVHKKHFYILQGKSPRSHQMSWWDNLFTFCIKKKTVLLWYDQHTKSYRYLTYTT